MRQHEEFVLFPLCFNDTNDVADTDDSDNAADESTTGNEETATFTQEQVNEFMAKDRRKNEEKFKRQYEKLESQMKQQIQRAGNDSEERERLQQELEDLQATFRTKEQQVEWEKKQTEKKYQTDLENERKERERWEKLYRQEKIDRSLLDAASSQDAFNPTLIVDLLRPAAELKADNVEGQGYTFATMVNFNDIDEKTGEPIRTLRTPEDAVKRMKELPQLYGGLFRANVVSGVGAGSAEATPGAHAKLNLKDLTPEQYRKIRKENPELLGLPQKRY